MTDVVGGGAVYVIRVERVRQSIEALLDRDTHSFFAAYLHLRRTAAQLGRTTDLPLDLADLAEVLAVEGGPPGKPYLRPFWRGQREAGQEWLNSNLAGSYAPSSLRGVPMRVVEVDAHRHFNLREGHWNIAREELLYDEPLPALALASFLFRDQAITSSGPEPTTDVLIELFREEYGYGGDDSQEFATLYDVTWQGPLGDVAEPWFEQMETGE